ncbi:hypothetical protein RPHASCH2410_CH14385 [Rhizobium phaseoli Ch24-10]|nr:hypothetical protein RPHASCH2410_CH14385 [Rhizobium phaseoli Ch24-10]
MRWQDLELVVSHSLALLLLLGEGGVNFPEPLSVRLRDAPFGVVTRIEKLRFAAF